jgi:protein associated with RNAse G/E
MPFDPTAIGVSLIDTHNVDLTAHGGSPLSTAINDFIVGSAIGTWIKKTLAETRTILGIPSGGAGDVVGPAGATNNHVVFFDGATGKLIKDSGLGLSGSNTGDQTLPVKATGAELDTGADDAKFATAKAIKDSHNVPSVVPSTAGKILTSDGTDWISSAPAAVSIVRMSVFTFEGILTVVPGAVRIYNKLGVTMTISQVFIAVNTAPTDAAIIVDVNKNGTTIFTNQAHRPQIAASAFTGFSVDIDVPALADGDYLTVDVDAIGSTIAGSNLTVHVVYS